MSRADLVDAIIDRAIEERRLVGAVVLVAENGKIIYSRAAGLADREGDKPMQDNTIFRASSLTKPIVAATALAMMDAGLLSLTDPVTRYLPYFRPKLADGGEPVITLAHLLSHTAGLAYAYPGNPRITTGLLDTDMTLEETLKLIAEQPLSYEPGRSWLYSVSIDVLGGVIEAVHGGPLDRAVAHYVTDPLGMADTVFGVTDPSRLAAAYGDGADEPVLMGEPHAMTNPWGDVTRFSPTRIFNAKAFLSGGAGMSTTGPDFLVFLEAMLHGGGKVLRPETARLALQNQTGAVEREPGKGFSFLGNYTLDPIAANAPWTSGTNNWGGIYGHIWSIEPSRGISMVSLTNTAFYGGELAFPEAMRKAVHSHQA